MSDEKLGVLLNAKGYNIARRTVAKWREHRHSRGPPPQRTVMNTLAKLVSAVLHPLCMLLLTLAVVGHGRLLGPPFGVVFHFFVLLLINTLAPASSM